MLADVGEVGADVDDIGQGGVVRLQQSFQRLEDTLQGCSANESPSAIWPEINNSAQPATCSMAVKVPRRQLPSRVLHEATAVD